MTARLTIAVDAMGGDHAPGAILAGADMALERYPNIFFRLVGDEAVIRAHLGGLKRLAAAHDIVHAPGVVPADMKPSVALRQGRDSSMRKAIDLVHHGDAACVISAGNTGALMAMAKFVLKTLPGIDRPAIASFFPTMHGESVMLDLGANVDCDADILVQFAIMGAVFAHTVLGVLQPSIGLLNVGAEEMKGRDSLRVAAETLRQMVESRRLLGQFYGFIEGNDIPAGTVDVIVTDGFTGNVALKTAEGTAKLYSAFLKQTFKASLMARLGYLLAKPAFEKLRYRTDPRRYNGAMFLGLQGVCVKSHGGTDAVGFANAIGVAHDLVAQKCNDKIRTGLAMMADGIMAAEAASQTDTGVPV